MLITIKSQIKRNFISIIIISLFILIIILFIFINLQFIIMLKKVSQSTNQSLIFMNLYFKDNLYYQLKFSLTPFLSILIISSINLLIISILRFQLKLISIFPTFH